MTHARSRSPDGDQLKQQQVRRILDTPVDEAFDRLTRLAAKSLRAPVSILTFIDGDRQWFKSSHGLAEPWASRRETPLSHSFCQYVVASERPLVVEDARRNALVQENRAIPELGVEAYIGAPLTDESGAVFGSFAVIDSHPRSWTGEDVEMVRDFAAVAMAEVELKTEIALREEKEASLRQAQKMESLGRLACGIAHDFNNLLTVFNGNCALLLTEMDPSDSRRQEIEEMHGAAVRAARLTAQLLAFGQGKLLDRRPVDLNELLEAIVPMLRRLLPQTLDLNLRLAEEAGLVMADQGQLEQVVMNLVLNARDAMPDGGTITIRTAPVEDAGGADGGGFALLEVEDTGAGIDPGSGERIFEPFFTTKQGVHSGLGLSTVHGVVTQSGGRIEVDSEPGRGARFSVVLPRPHRASGAGSAAHAPVDDPGGSEVVLLVEDDPAVCRIAERILRHWGYRVVTADSLATTLDVWHSLEDPADLLVVDVDLPGASGVHIAKTLQSMAPDLSVLFVSGHADDVLHRSFEGDHVPAFLEKPFTLQSLGKKVREVLNGVHP
jgi:two-component system, cell cycle sensor histidine kinase and response regulator CckA